MDIRLTKWGEKLSERSGIQELMEDLGNAMSGETDMLMLGGGNPAVIPEIATLWRKRFAELLANSQGLDSLLGHYDTPQGNPVFIRSLVRYFRNRLGLKIAPENVAITNGSQQATYILFNMLAGKMDDGRYRRILLPLCPEYIGYADQGPVAGFFTGVKPKIELVDDRQFKYHVDFDSLNPQKDVGALCLSRPTNPTGNVLHDDELHHLHALAKQRGLPLIIDNAYGLPFPGIVFTPCSLWWDEDLILTFSLSKLGLPGLRTGIVVASEPIARAVSRINAVLNLANGNLGQAMVEPLLDSGSMSILTEGTIRPYYQGRARSAIETLQRNMPAGVPWRLHKAEGALFLWLWLQDLPVSCRTLYDRLKAKGLLVVPGSYFFPGLEDVDWRHKDECLRITYSQAPEKVERGLELLAGEVDVLYRNGA